MCANSSRLTGSFRAAPARLLAILLAAILLPGEWTLACRVGIPKHLVETLA
jgi:hypothetical protein